MFAQDLVDVGAALLQHVGDGGTDAHGGLQVLQVVLCSAGGLCLHGARPTAGGGAIDHPSLGQEGLAQQAFLWPQRKKRFV